MKQTRIRRPRAASRRNEATSDGARGYRCEALKRLDDLLARIEKDGVPS